MRLSGQASAAMEILRDMERLHLPAARALADWGRAHRFAGSGDRAVIGTIVHDVLRNRASLAWAMGDDAARALVLGWLAQARRLDVAAIEALGTERHGFGPLSQAERKAIATPRPLEEAPLWVRADVPQWLEASLVERFGARAEEAGRAMAQRAPLDLRVNTLKAERHRVLRALARLGAEETPHSPWGLRIRPDARGRLPRVEAESAHGRGWFEVQDEGSQIVSALCGARPGEQVLDLCAGAGGKTLALAAMMENRGQIHAHDAERGRLRPMFERLRRAGVRNVQVIEPQARERLEALRERMDLVLVDAPCSGSGTWRRRPDAKWRLGEKQLAARMAAQQNLLEEAVRYLRPGGRLVYVTCSFLKQENEEPVERLLAGRADFSAIDWRSMAGSPALPRLPEAPQEGPFLQLAPHLHGTDGFFLAIMKRAQAG